MEIDSKVLAIVGELFLVTRLQGEAIQGLEQRLKAIEEAQPLEDVLAQAGMVAAGPVETNGRGRRRGA